ncbi:hypothetical protein JHK82_036420 [Glycine max]|nr:hypothetical protein JHK85_037147 [Glycine max]KAG4977130.1 hypothetical protein JHK86_036604 [Glycine max]KAG5113151.1 hypothetical protein JHK82_036420 [Glycine max]
MSVPSLFAVTMWTPFTTAQWHELEHQTLLFKYLKAGISVPPDLLLPIRKTLLFKYLKAVGYYGKNSWNRSPI